MDKSYGDFRFRVEWGGASVSFTEVSGLKMEIQVIEYRTGDEPSLTPRKLPGLIKYSNITLKRGITDNAEFFEWFRTASRGNPERRSSSCPASLCAAA